MDADGDTKLTPTVDRGDGSEVRATERGVDPFKVKHNSVRAGTSTLQGTWTDGTGLSNSRDLTRVVTPRHQR